MDAAGIGGGAGHRARGHGLGRTGREEGLDGEQGGGARVPLTADVA